MAGRDISYPASLIGDDHNYISVLNRGAHGTDIYKDRETGLFLMS